MQIRIKTIEHERTEDAPFVGALISAVGCKLKCKNCFNRHLKKAPTLKLEASEIIKEVKDNPINEGIILAGLEWSEQAIEMLELMGEASKAGLKIMIYTGLDMMEFYSKIGKECYTVIVDVKVDKNKVESGFFGGFFETLGAVMIDYRTPNGYFLKTGRYDENHPAEPDYGKFGVKLSSSNQHIYEIKGEDYRAETDKDQVSM